MIFDEYVNYTRTYKAEYGENTIILMEVGSFWELYDCDKRSGADMKEIGELLNIQVSRKNKAIAEVSSSNPLMAGFPTHALQRFLPILIASGYTIVLVSQVTLPPNPKRAVTNIYSKGTYLDGAKTSECANIAAIFIEKTVDVRAGKEVFNIGLSIVDVTTGHSFVKETSSKVDDKMFPFDDTYKVLSTYNPCEIIIFGSDLGDCMTVASLKMMWDITDNVNVYDMIDTYDKEVHKICYQNEILSRVFTGAKNNNMLSAIEFLDLEKSYYSLTSFVELIRYVYKHNEILISRLSRPAVLNDDELMNISYNAHQQLDVQGLCKIINRCSTAIGKRYFKNRLSSPFKSPEAIQPSYDMIDMLSSSLTLKQLNLVAHELKSVYDLERLYRKMLLGRIHPSELSQVIQSLYTANALCKEYAVVKNVDASVQDHLQIIQDVLNNTLDLEECSKYNIDNINGRIFKSEYDAELDKCISILSKIDDNLQKLGSQLNKLNPNASGFFKIESNEKDGFYLLITSKRFKEMQNDLVNFNFEFKITTDSTNMFTFEKVKQQSVQTNYLKLTHPVLELIWQSKQKMMQTLHERNASLFKSFIQTVANANETAFEYSSKFIAHLDFYTCCARNAIEFAYNKPTITSLPFTSSSCASFKSIRHPIIERINQSTAYIGNDIEIGTETHGGILLYGLNAAGKSSLMKAVGLNIIMAQCGMFVACNNMEYAPFSNLFTRINRLDNLYKGQSTFMVEMSELRNILRRADKNSIVIGDELCSGTESNSAVSIVSAGIISLIKMNTPFIFATHLHDLVKVEMLQNIPNLQVYHLDVLFDKAKDKLIYNRVLKLGQGSSLYGLEVCKALDLGNDFVSLAMDIRNKFLGNDQDAKLKRSHYNKNHFVNQCAVCNNDGTDVHHIHQQKDADANGLIDHRHKNHCSNLVTLCQKCHDDVHHGSLVIDGYIATSEGPTLSYHFKVANDVILKEEEYIENTIRRMRYVEKKTLDNIVAHLLQQNIIITKYKVSKISKQIGPI